MFDSHSEWFFTDLTEKDIRWITNAVTETVDENLSEKDIEALNVKFGYTVTQHLFRKFHNALLSIVDVKKYQNVSEIYLIAILPEYDVDPTRLMESIDDDFEYNQRFLTKFGKVWSYNQPKLLTHMATISALLQGIWKKETRPTPKEWRNHLIRKIVDIFEDFTKMYCEARDISDEKKKELLAEKMEVTEEHPRTSTPIAENVPFDFSMRTCDTPESPIWRADYGESEVETQENVEINFDDYPKYPSVFHQDLFKSATDAAGKEADAEPQEKNQEDTSKEANVIEIDPDDCIVNLILDACRNNCSDAFTEVKNDFEKKHCSVESESQKEPAEYADKMVEKISFRLSKIVIKMIQNWVYYTIRPNQDRNEIYRRIVYRVEKPLVAIAKEKREALEEFVSEFLRNKQFKDQPMPETPVPAPTAFENLISPLLLPPPISAPAPAAPGSASGPAPVLVPAAVQDLISPLLLPPPISAPFQAPGPISLSASGPAPAPAPFLAPGPVPLPASGPVLDPYLLYDPRPAPGPAPATDPYLAPVPALFFASGNAVFPALGPAPLFAPGPAPLLAQGFSPFPAQCLVPDLAQTAAPPPNAFCQSGPYEVTNENYVPLQKPVPVLFKPHPGALFSQDFHQVGFKYVTQAIPILAPSIGLGPAPAPGPFEAFFGL